MIRRTFTCLLFCIPGFVPAPAQEPQSGRWSAERAAAWQRERPWLVGCNFIPSTAINQLEMWQADTFDVATIDRELGWAQDLGFTSIRVFLHDLLWKQDKDGFLKRMDQFLAVADRHKIGVLFVLLDSCWDPHPKLGPQRPPKPHVHNSGWVQSPGAEVIRDPKRHDELKDYVQGVLRHFKNDRRIHGWDQINEPNNTNNNSYGKLEPPDKPKLALMLLRKVFAWAREVNPDQPLTSAPWEGDWSSLEKLSPINRFMFENSDIISFHEYGDLNAMKRRVGEVKKLAGRGSPDPARPIICTEFMARPNRSTFDPHLGYLQEEKVGAYCWGFVAGKTQTQYPWDSWQKTYAAEPKLWFHDIFRKDGSAYRAEEVDYIKRVTAKARQAPPKDVDLKETAVTFSDDDAALRDVLQRAIKALGGEAKLTKLNAVTWKGKVTGYGPEGKAIATGDWYLQGPDQFRRDVDIEIDGQRVQTSMIINGKEGWVKARDNMVYPIEKDAFARTKANRVYAFWVTTLVPLKEKEFTLSPLGELKIGDRLTVGIKAAHAGYPDINLFFDKQTNLLLRSEMIIQPDSGTDDEITRMVTEERLYSDYQESGGVRRARKITANYDGKLRWEMEIQEFRPQERLDDSIFARP